jgi:NitT/TauT family transport system substrate-binding protein
MVTVTVKSFRWIAGLMAVLSLSLMVRAQTPQPERFLLTFIPNIQFAPMYVAIEQGYFADAGYELTLEYLNEPDVIDLVAAGQVHFGVASGEQVILANARSRPVNFVYNWFQQYPVGIVTSVESGITSMEDFKGKRIGIPGRFGASYTGLVALLNAANLTEEDVELVEIGFNAPEALCTGQVDAASVYSNNEPLQIRARAAAGECDSISDVTVIPVSDAGSFVSNGLITNTTYITESPDRVQAFVSAFDHGLKDAINNPARAYLLSAPSIESLPLTPELEARLTELADAQDAFLADAPTREEITASREDLRTQLHEEFDDATLIQFDILLNTIEMWDADVPGFSDLDAWENMVNTLTVMGLLDTDVNLDRIYTNEFVPEPPASNG